MHKVIGGNCYHQHKYLLEKNHNSNKKQSRKKGNVVEIKNYSILNENVEHGV